jgi:predicted nucleic acid-binding protein
MNACVVDASVAVKWYVSERNSIRAIKLLTAKDIKKIVPELLFAECANAVNKKSGAGDISDEEGRKVIESLLQSPFVVHSSKDLIAMAFEIATLINQSVYDCIYLALALASACPLITADERFYRAVSRTHFAGAVILL